MTRLRVFTADNGERPVLDTSDPVWIGDALKTIGVRYERWPLRDIGGADSDAVLAAYAPEIDKLKTDIQKMMKGKEAFINIHEVRRPDLDPQLVAENIALQLERRVTFRRAMKEAVLRAMRMGAQGVRVQVSGRLGGAEIARREWYREGRVPLQTLRADVAYGFAEARTTYGVIGVKVWIFRGEILTRQEEAAKRAGAAQQG